MEKLNILGTCHAMTLGCYNNKKRKEESLERKNKEKLFIYNNYYTCGN